MTGPPEGMLTLDELRKLVAGDDVDTVVVGFTDHYGRLVGKRYDAGMFVDEVAAAGTWCDYLLTTDMEMEPVPGYRFANWELGYGDVHLVPDLPTLRRADWLDRTTLVLCDVADSRDHALAAAPTVLRRQVDAATGQGLTAMAATRAGVLPVPLVVPGDAAASGYNELGRPAGTSRTTTCCRAPAPRTSPPPCAAAPLGRAGRVEQGRVGRRPARAQRALRRRAGHGRPPRRLQAVPQGHADRLGASVTFMAKVATGQAGSSCHVHMSLWRDGANVRRRRRAGPVRCSDEFRWFLGGVLAHVPDVMVFLAPTVNSYKRYVDGSWAPTASPGATTTAPPVRVVGDGNLRIGAASPVPTATRTWHWRRCSPRRHLPVQTAAVLRGDGRAARDLPHVPRSLAEANDLFVASVRHRRLRRGGGRPLRPFFRTEWEAYTSAVSDWERRRYFERI